MPTAFLGIGANLGDRRDNCQRAVEMLRAQPGVQVMACSPWNTYPALTLTPDVVQPDFVNGVVQVATTLSPEALLAACHAIERQLGRSRSETSTPGAAEPLIRERHPEQRWAPRTIDIDLLLYDDLVLTTPTLTIPHPELAKRMFVLAPLAMLAPDRMHPILGKTIKELYHAILPR